MSVLTRSPARAEGGRRPLGERTPLWVWLAGIAIVGTAIPYVRGALLALTGDGMGMGGH